MNIEQGMSKGGYAFFSFFIRNSLFDILHFFPFSTTTFLVSTPTSHFHEKNVPGAAQRGTPPAAGRLPAE
jgi:hypothetical protein